MGITIHFRGKIKPLTGIQSLVDDFQSIAEGLKWKYKILDYDFSESQSLKGIVLSPHLKSESLFLLFDTQSNLNNPIGIQFEKRNKQHKWNSIKTQFAPLHIHIAVAKMLQCVKSKYIPKLEVFDEGDYWNTGNQEGLDERREILNRAMDLLEEDKNSNQ